MTIQMRPPRIYVDFNKRIGEGTYRLTTVGTRQSLERERITLAPGMVLVAYMEDETADGRQCCLAADAVIVQAENGELLAKVDSATFREEPRA